LVKPNPGEYSHGKGNHTNGLEGFWAYLQRRLAAVSERKDCLCIWLDMFGDTIIEMIVFNNRKNSFLNHLKGSCLEAFLRLYPKIYCGDRITVWEIEEWFAVQISYGGYTTNHREKPAKSEKISA